jgi:hypothetical protein
VDGKDRKKHKRNTRFEKPEPLQSRRATRT